MTIAVTGGTGFVGQAVVDEARRRGQPLRALARREQAACDGIDWVRGDLADRAALRLHALRPQARLQLLRQRQREALRRLRAAWQRRGERDAARLGHADAVLRAVHPRRRLARLHERLDALAPRPRAALARKLASDALRLRGLARSLAAVSPLATVARGYAILQHADGRIVRSVGDAAAGDALDARVSDGQLRLRVEGAARDS